MGHLTSGVPGQMLFRVSPPRMPKNCVDRGAALLPSYIEDFRSVVVQAPAGFGKTFLLNQWRRNFLSQGRVCPWISVHSDDDPQKLLHALVYSFRMAAGRPTFGHALLQSLSSNILENGTAFLTEISQYSLQTVVFLDDADRLSANAKDLISYLIRNAPANLIVLLASRSDCDFGLDDLVTYGTCLVVGSSLLRFTLDDSINLFSQKLGSSTDRDKIARLHQMVEGWPLGIQLCLSMLGQSATPSKALSAFLEQGQSLQIDLVDHLLGHLAGNDASLLVRLSAIDHLYPDLCRAVSDVDDIDRQLDRLANESAVLHQAEQGGFYRLHNLVRQNMLHKFNQLPEFERRDVHVKASRWFVGFGQLDVAALHALQAGEHSLAYDLAERSLYESLMLRGQQTQVVDWLERLPQNVVEERPKLGLAVAWSLALSERHHEALELVERLLSLPDSNEELQYECALILSGAAIFADNPDQFLNLHEPWAEKTPLNHAFLQKIHLNRNAYSLLIRGNPSLARLKLQQGPVFVGPSPHGYLSQWGELVMGLTYLWEGQVLLAEKLLRPALAQADQDLGRRSPFACMLASYLAAAVWEQDRPHEAITILADRLDILERHGMPEAVLLAYRTLARAAIFEGSEHRAIELLDAMNAIGVARQIPRISIASLVDQIRMHARRYRAETCGKLYSEALSLFNDQSEGRGELWLKSARALLSLASGYNAIASRRWRDAIQELNGAYDEAYKLRMGRLRIEIIGLRAFALYQVGEQTEEMLREALDLSKAFGLKRVFTDAHPDLGNWLQRVVKSPVQDDDHSTVTAAPVQYRIPGNSVASFALTPKERKIVELLAMNLSNKEIGLAMDVGEETVKWHMKNLFAKLDAGNRKQVVARARLFGLVGG
jgi:LuxR family transcriptional regulator, maltose regulon positive regulatory protein